MTPQIASIAGSIFGALAIILGAFGAHALKKRFTPELMQSFETGVKYQMYHAIVLLVLGLNLNYPGKNRYLVLYYRNYFILI